MSQDFRFIKNFCFLQKKLRNGNGDQQFYNLFFATHQVCKFNNKLNPIIIVITMTMTRVFQRKAQNEKVNPYFLVK